VECPWTMKTGARGFLTGQLVQFPTKRTSKHTEGQGDYFLLICFFAVLIMRPNRLSFLRL